MQLYAIYSVLIVCIRRLRMADLGGLTRKHISSYVLSKQFTDHAAFAFSHHLAFNTCYHWLLLTW